MRSLLGDLHLPCQQHRLFGCTMCYPSEDPMSNDEKVTENIKEIVNGAGRIIDSLGNLLGRGRNNNPPKEETKNVGRRSDDDDDIEDEIDKQMNQPGSITTKLLDDKIAVIFMSGDRPVKQVKLSEDETDSLIKDLQKRLKGLRAQKDE